jgi:outer membrane protein assembly factor BamE (lipoprotein component of BamABCDE complex)
MFIVHIPKLATRDRMTTLEVRSLFVLYDTAGRVEKFTHHIGESKGFAVAGNETWRSGKPLSMEKIRKIEQGTTTKDELIEMFGRPTIEGFDVYGLTVMSWIYAEGRNASLTVGQELVVRVDVEVVADLALRNLRP